jgi:hypothetical protein
MPSIRSRRGKIARLPLAVREQLNTRLRNGEEGKALLLWLNALPDVQQILTAHFKGKPIAQCNLSEWRKGGYVDWFLLQQLTPDTRAAEVLAMAPDMVPAVQGGLADKMAVLLFSHLLAQFKRLPLASDSPDEAKLWRELRLGLAALKRYEYFARKEQREEAADEARPAAEKPRRLTEEQKERKAAIILGLDPDRPRINPETDLFEGPGADALNEQRQRIKAELAAEREERLRTAAGTLGQPFSTQTAMT